MNIEKIKNKLFTIEAVIASIESYLLSFCLLTMLFIGALQVVLRNFFSTGLDWGDMLVRCLVLWVGFTGASIATRRSRHINIEVISRLISNQKFSSLRFRLVNIVAFIISALLLNASIHYIFLEAENNMTAFLGVPTWVVFIIVPVSFLLISLRLLIQIFTNKPIEEETL
jgi:TRAP-type C4-dicarboxylate transport system permease small subunit